MTQGMSRPASLLRSLALASLVLASAPPSAASAQNSSLLHAPSANTAARLPRDRGGSLQISQRPPIGSTATGTSDRNPADRAAPPSGAPAGTHPAPLTGQLRQFAGPGPAPSPGADSRGEHPSSASGGRTARPLSLRDVSWTHRPAPALRTFDINDIVTIRVDEMSRMMAEGEAESRKQTMFEAILTDWIKLSDGRLRPDPQEDGDPAVGNESSSRTRNEASLESSESLSFNIAARVVDIRPNGNLVLEARKSYRVNDNQWETSLTGVCRAKDIAADNVVLSRDMIDLQIIKEDHGQVRDGYRRGWFSRLFDRMQPF